jgi:hypothetical protein
MFLRVLFSSQCDENKTLEQKKAGKKPRYYSYYIKMVNYHIFYSYVMIEKLMCR